MEKVPVEPIKLKAIWLHNQGLMTWQEMARRMGYVVGDRADTRRLKVALGMRPYGTYQDKLYENVTVETARRFCDVLELDPYCVGI